MEGRWSLLLTSYSSASCSSRSLTASHYNNCYYSSPKPHFPRRLGFVLKTFLFSSSTPSRFFFHSLVRPTSALVFDGQLLQKSDVTSSTSSSSSKEMLPKIDKSGRFCSPRAARELALSILYAACLEGSDPVRLFEKRINVRWEAGYEFEKELLMQYNHMSFGGPPVAANTVAEADHLLLLDQKESEIEPLLSTVCFFLSSLRRLYNKVLEFLEKTIQQEAEVLSAPPKLVYSKLILRFTRKLLVAVVEKWDDHVLVIDKVAPPNWKNDPAGRILELSILHLAMSEIAVVGTRHQIVVNEAVDLAKRFCDGAAPRIINGCLRSFIKHFTEAVHNELNSNGRV